jgi:hypothetical protein
MYTQATGKFNQQLPVLAGLDFFTGADLSRWVRVSRSLRSLSSLFSPVRVFEVVFEALGVMIVKISQGVTRKERLVGFGGGEGCCCSVGGGGGGGSLSFLRLSESFERPPPPPPATLCCWRDSSASIIKFYVCIVISKSVPVIGEKNHIMFK